MEDSDVLYFFCDDTRCGWAEKDSLRTHLFGGVELLLEFLVATSSFLVDLAAVVECSDIHFLCEMRGRRGGTR